MSRTREHDDLEPLTTPLHDLVVQTRLLFHRLRDVGERLHADDELTAGQRGVLLNLHQRGPSTVPQLARLRPVSRQHIQALVNPLRDRGLVELLDNPEHRRSHLVSLTASGRTTVARILDREKGPLAGVAAEVGPRRIARAAAVLRDVREALGAVATEPAAGGTPVSRRRNSSPGGRR